jgi:hypothetical protein
MNSSSVFLPKTDNTNSEIIHSQKPLNNGHKLFKDHNSEKQDTINYKHIHGIPYKKKRMKNEEIALPLQVIKR